MTYMGIDAAVRRGMADPEGDMRMLVCPETGDWMFIGACQERADAGQRQCVRCHERKDTVRGIAAHREGRR